jgi:hypothetical protein
MDPQGSFLMSDSIMEGLNPTLMGRWTWEEKYAIEGSDGKKSVHANGSGEFPSECHDSETEEIRRLLS